MSDSVTQPAIRRFEDLGLSEQSLESIAKKGFEAPTRIQAEVIPHLLAGDRDVIAQSHTGTGKTAAFGLPLIQLLTPSKLGIQSLILVPTRELAVQVAEELNSLRGNKPLHIVPMYGGQSYELQFRHLRTGVDILVGTPGRIIDHLNRGSLKLDKVHWAVLDEADEMLDMGFIEDIEAILGTCNPDKRMLLFSATMPPRIRAMAQTWMRNMTEVSVKSSALTTSNTEQTYMEVLEQDKFEALCRIMDHSVDFYGMVFGRTKVECDNLHRRLVERGYGAEVLHGDINQAGREKVLKAFRKRTIDVLVATDVAARGIDVENLTHVVNYSLPSDSESYVHRIGRTGRAGKEGRAITFITPSEFRKLSMIQRMAKSEIKRERPPRVDEILEIKRQRLVDEYKKALGVANPDDLEVDGSNPQITESPEIFKQFAFELMDHGRSVGLEIHEIMAKLLFVQLNEELDASQYGKVTELQAGGPRSNAGGYDRGDRFSRDRGDRGDRGSRDRGERGDRPYGRDRSFGRERDFGGASREGGERRPRADFGDRPPRTDRFHDNGDGVKLFVARGKVDGMTKPKLVEFIRRGSGVRDRDIDNVELFEFHSFITVPPGEADKVKRAFTETGKDGKPVVRPAGSDDGQRSDKPKRASSFKGKSKEKTDFKYDFDSGYKPPKGE